jgi:hypothetical protein
MIGFSTILGQQVGLHSTFLTRDVVVKLHSLRLCRVHRVLQHGSLLGSLCLLSLAFRAMPASYHELTPQRWLCDLGP